MVDLNQTEGRIAVKDGQLIIEGLVFDYMPKIETDLTLVFRGNIVRNAYDTIRISMPRENALVTDNVFGTVEVRRPSRWRPLKRALGVPWGLAWLLLLYGAIPVGVGAAVYWMCTGESGIVTLERYLDWIMSSYWSSFHDWANR